MQTFEILLGGVRIERVTKFEYLGVTLDQHMIWHEQVESIGKKVAKRLGILSRIRYYLTLEAANSIYNTMIQPIFDYDTSWGVLSEVCKNELQRLQNRAARIVLRRNRTENCLSSLNWLHLSTRMKIHRCILVFKILNNCVPVYINNYFTKNSSVHSFNTRHKDNFVLPKVKREFGKRTFRFTGAKDYNDLSTDITS